MLSIENGFSLIEVLVTASVIGVLAATAIPTFIDYRTGAYDDTARVDARNIFTALLAEGADPDNTPAVLVFNQLGPQRLPGALNTVSISSGVRLLYAMRMDAFLGPLYLVYLWHEKGERRIIQYKYGPIDYYQEFPL